MLTTFHFEVFAPGMKAKLDPSYRRASVGTRLPDRAEILGKVARSSRQSFIPFTTVKKSFHIFDR